MRRNRFRRLSAGVLLAALTLTAASCGGGPLPEQTREPQTAAPQTTEPAQPVRLILPCSPDESFHPITGSSRSNLVLGGLIYEGLFQMGPDFQPHPQLCSDWSVSEDGLTWTFSLREDAVFSDGTPLSAAQAAASLMLAKTSALYAPRLTHVVSIVPVGQQVQLVLSQPNGGLPALLDIPVVLETGGPVPLGTGPYVLECSGEEYRLSARPDRPPEQELPVREIPLYPVRRREELVRAFDTRAVTLVTDDLTSAGALGFSAFCETVDYPTSDMLYLGFNCTSGPCREAAVRRALQRSVDRETVAGLQLSRHGRPAALPAPPESQVYDEGLAGQLIYDLRAAEQELTSAGWSGGPGGWRREGKALSLQLLTAADGGHTEIARFLADSLTQAGYRIQLVSLPWEEYLAALEQGRFDLYLGEVRLTGDLDPSALIAPGGSLNYGGYEDPGLLPPLETYRAAFGGGRVAAGRVLHRYLAEQAPLAVICFKNWSVLTQWELVSGMTPTQQNIFHGFADWTISP